MKRLFVTLFTALCFIIPGQSQNQTDSIKRALVDLYAQIVVFPQEKIYLQTDRPYYMNGEKMHFRAYIIHASTNKPAYISRYIYVELLAPNNTLAVRQQIRMEDDNMFYGHLELPESLPEGNYTLRAYTRYMENLDESQFYTRPVFIIDPNSAKAEIETNFEFVGTKQVNVGMRFRDVHTKEILYPNYVELQLGQNDKSTRVEPNEEGWIYKKFNLKDEDTERCLSLEYRAEYNSFKKYIRIPYNSKKPEIGFYPEGGNLIAEQENKVAFKALLPDGETADIKGAIFNSQNEQLTTFASTHEGMGVFNFIPHQGETYYAECNYENQSIKINLPEIRSNTYNLQALWEGDSLSVSVCKPEESPAEELYLLIHRQGVPLYFKEWNLSDTNKKWAKNKLPTGVTHLMLLSGNFTPVSERLIFNYVKDDININIQTPKNTYVRREHVKLNIDLVNQPIDTIPSTFAISVTDDRDVKLDTTTNLMSEIMLASELKGRINNPKWYFQDNKEAEQAADLLMLTHGWRRYHITEAIQRNLQKPAIKPEITQAFSGVLKKPSGKLAKKGKIKITAVGYHFSEAYEVDEKARYLFDNFEFPDSTAYFFLAVTDKNKPEVEIHLDPIKYPNITNLQIHEEDLSKKISNDEFDEYITKANGKYILENGMRLIDLPEITIQTKDKRNTKRLKNSTPVPPDRLITSENIEENPPTSFEELFLRMPTITNVSDNEGVIVRGTPAKFVLNGINLNCSYSELSNLVNVNDIAQVDLYTEAGKTLVFSSNSAPVIALTTWPPGMRAKASTPTNTKLILPLGYQQYVEFYSPKYDTQEKLDDSTPDLRSTIYWKPNIIADSNNKASVDFYTADDKTTYSIVIEGITKNKNFIYERKDAFIKVE
ncbi:hypothetical protein D0T53_05710 [Dysgonomonas sp. 216]|uniref:Plug domain-containing protein n=1 Tax=Dysgonomonas sp. 216 TaxID=2302934 RepID=UPI0013D6B60E|nr:Plug domain-containing protein [Dysgonomonas sp. 216]NDW18411.1 hypothetical protein [Dysgonomonas sp. 216]